MPTVVEGSLADGGRVVDDRWLAVETIDGAPAGASLLVPLALWQAGRDALIARGTPLGVQLPPDTDPADIADDLPHFALVAVEFPKFTDGRGYSIGRLLRERHGFSGTLRAVGDVLRDQVFYLLRCGFDSFALRHPEHADAALAAYRDFSNAYQAAVDRPVPLFARRGAVEPAATT